MKTKFKSFCLTALLMLFGQASLWAYDAKIDGIYYYLYGNATVTYRSSNSDNSIYSSDYSGNIVIPQLVSYRQTYKVTSIGYHAFDGCTGLTSIEIPSSVTSIGDYAFRGCTGLTNIEIPSSVTSIGGSAFYGCSGLTSIGYHAFDGCTGLTSIEIPSSVTSIGGGAFSGCTGLTSILLPKDIAIGGMFTGCTNIQYNEYDNALYLGTEDNPFYYLIKAASTEITSCEINANCKRIAAGAFGNCNELVRVDIPNGVQIIEENAFSGCKALKTAFIPNSVTSIGSQVFYGCTSLESLTLPYVLPYYYYKNDSPTRSRFPFGYIFGGGDVTITNKLHTYPPSDATYSIPSSLKYVTITGGDIPHYAFYNYTTLWDITISSDVSISTIYAPLTGVKHVNYGSGPGTYGFCGAFCVNGITDGNFIYADEGKTQLMDYLGNIGDVVVPDKVKSIGERAFDGCSGLNSISIPKSVEYIGANAFRNCVGKLIVKCNIGSASSNSNGWFYGSKFYSVEIEGNVFDIGDYAFYGCTSLTDIEFSNGLTNIGNSAFYGCTGLTSIDMPSSVTSIGTYAFYGCKSLTDIEFSNGLTDIGNSAFSGCTSLIDIKLPNGLTNIGNSAFSGCSSLTSIALPFVGDKQHTETDTYQYPFGYIFGTESYTGGTATPQTYYGYSISSTTSSTYYIPSSLKSVKITGGSYIPYGAFYGCSKLTNVEIPNSVNSIGSKSFYGCSNIQTLIIGSGVTSIGTSAFSTSPTKVFWLCNTPPTNYQVAQGKVNYVANANFSSLTNVKVYSYLSSMFDVDGVKYVLVNPSQRTCDAVSVLSVGQDSVLNIGDKVSYRNIALSIRLIGQYFAYNEKGITDLSMQDGITDIQAYAFSDCSNLQTVQVCNTVTSLGNSVFSGCRALTDIVIPDNVTQIGASAFSGCTSLATINLGNNVKTLGQYVLQNCGALTSITLPARLTSVGDYAFQGCTSLSRIINDNHTTTLTLGSNGSSSLFSDCPLDSVYIGGPIRYKTASSSGYSPFYRNTTLRAVTVSDNETTISDNEFYGCTNLKAVSIGDGVKSIGKYAFSGCSSLESFVFGSGMKSIGQEAFSDCSALTSLYSEAATPPTCGTQALEDINKWECTLYVPSENIMQYQTANQWQDFFFVDANPYTSEPITQLSITDGDALVIPTSTTYETVNYSRTFSSADKWQAFYVPFSIPVETLAENGLEVAELNNIHMYDTDEDGEFDKTTLEFLYLKRGATQPNYPYLIKSTSAGDVTLAMTDIEVKATEETEIECASTRRRFIVRGTYAGVSGAVMYANNYYAMGGGTLVRMANADSGLKPQRWYLAVENKDGSPVEYLAAQMRIAIDGIEIEESETAISEVNAIGQKQDEVYMLDGRKLNGTDALKSGLYVKNHKKLFVR